MALNLVKIAFVIAVACGSLSACQTTQREVAKVGSGEVISLLDSTLSVDTIALGHMKSGEIIRREVTLRNESLKPIVIISVSSSCGCTKVDAPREPIPVQGEAPFSFEFDSKGFSGFQVKRITIRTSALAKPYVLILTADVN